MPTARKVQSSSALVRGEITTTDDSIVLPIEITGLPEVKASAEGDQIALPGFFPSGAPGEPELPAYRFKFLLPCDVDRESVMVTLEDAVWEDVPGEFDVAPAPPVGTFMEGKTVISWGSKDPASIVDGRDVAVYGEDALFPPRPVGPITTSRYRQWNLAYVMLYPVAYNPVQKGLSQLRSGTVRIHFSRKGPNEEKCIARNVDTFWNRFASDLENPTHREDFYSMSDARKAFASSPPVADYVIITTSHIQSLSEASDTKLSDFVTHKENLGYAVRVVTEGVAADDHHYMSGFSAQSRTENIRTWLEDRVVSWGIEYVLLIGEPDPSSFSPDVSLPMLLCYPLSAGGSDPVIGTYLDAATCTDLYYAELFGALGSVDWDCELLGMGDGYPGEYPDDFELPSYQGIPEDTEPDVSVGRIPYDGQWLNEWALSSTLSRWIAYETAEGQQSWRSKVLVASAILNFALEETQGGVVERPCSVLGDQFAQALKDLALSYDMDAFVLWETEGYMVPTALPDAPLTEDSIVDQWNTHYGFVAWCGHGWCDSVVRKWWEASTPEDGVCQTEELRLPAFFDVSSTWSLDDSHPSFVFASSCLTGRPSCIVYDTETCNLVDALLGGFGRQLGVVAATQDIWCRVEPFEENAARCSGDQRAYPYFCVQRMIGFDDRIGEALDWCRTNVNVGMNMGWRAWMNRLAFNLYADPSASHLVQGPDINEPPHEPDYLSPLDGASGMPTALTLSWNGGDPNPEDWVTYDVYFGTSNPPPLVESDHATEEYPVSGLQEGRCYFWQIVARDNHALETEGPTWCFHVGTGGMPTISVLRPDDEDVWVWGSSGQPIHWIRSDVPGDEVRIELLRADGTFYDTIASAAPNTGPGVDTGEYLWSIPDPYGIGSFKISVTCTDDLRYFGFSDVFTLKDPDQTTHHVPGDGYPTIQDAIDAASDGHTVIVSRGTWDSIYFKSKNITVRSKNPGDPDCVADTIIDGGKQGYVVRFGGSEPLTAVLSGFTIQNGSAEDGGGIYGNGSQATILNNTIRNNQASDDGGGICSCNGMIENNTISNNTAGDDGGGLCVCEGSIRNNTIADNASGDDGGGLAMCNGTIEHNRILRNSASGGANNSGGGVFACDGVIRHNTISANHSDYQGGGLYECDGVIEGNVIRDNEANLSPDSEGGGLMFCDASIQNNVISGNFAIRDGGGLAVCNGAIQNNTIWTNSAGQHGGAIARCAGSIRNCIMWGNAAPVGAQMWECGAAISFCCVEGGGGGTGSIDSDPQLDANLRLTDGSPCIDAGCSIPGLTDDIDGDERPQISTSEPRGDGSHFDIGADEFVGCLSFDAPAEVTASDGTCGSIEVCWSDLPGTYTYRVLRNGYPITEWGATPCYEDVNVTPGSVYSYEIEAKSECDSRALTTADDGYCLAPPDGPSAVEAAVGDGCAHVQVWWSTCALADQYQVWRDGQVLSDWLTEAKYSDPDVVPGAVYTYAVIARNACGTTLPEDSDEAEVRLGPYTITPYAGEGGGIEPSDPVPVTCGGSQEFTITEEDGYVIADVLVDGLSIGPVTTYLFEDVVSDHTIAATFREQGEVLEVSRSVGPYGCYWPAGDTLDVSLTFNSSQPISLSSMNFSEVIPQRWTFSSLVACPGDLIIQPDPGDYGVLDFQWLEPPSEFPATLVYRLNVPSGETGDKLIVGEGSYSMGPGPGLLGPITSIIPSCCHSADTNSDAIIAVTEISRLVTFYNADAYHCDETTNDGYAPFEGSQDCGAHDADYDPEDWEINIREISRLVTFYNAGCYVVDPSTADGFAPCLPER